MRALAWTFAGRAALWQATRSVLVAPGDLRGVGLAHLGRQMADETCVVKKRGAAGVCAVAGLGANEASKSAHQKGCGRKEGRCARAGAVS